MNIVPPVNSQLKAANWLSFIKQFIPLIKMDRILAFLWSIWKNRNNKIFRNEPCSPGLVLLWAKRASTEWRIRHKLSQPFEPSPHNHSTCRRKRSRWIIWRKLQGGFVKINYDGSKNSQVAASGFIIRDWDGRFIQAATFNLGAVSALVVEAITIRNGIWAVAKTGFTNNHIEGNNRIIIQAVKRQIQVPWEI